MVDPRPSDSRARSAAALISGPIRTTIFDAIVQQLRDDIRSGQLAPGSRLRQLEVAKRFEVSTTPVREAFAALEREGLVVSEPHRGVVVFNPTVRDLKETYEIRIPLEALATELAVPRMTPEDIAALGEILAAMEAAQQDVVLYNELNRQFHSTIYARADRQKLVTLIEELRDASAAYMRLYATIHPSSADTHADHVAIFEACRDGAPKRAARAMTTHLQHTVSFVSAGLSDQD